MHEDGVARLCAGAEQGPPARHGAEQRDVEQQAARVRRRLAADHRDLMLRGEAVQAAVDGEHAFDIVALRQRERDDRRDRRAAHRGDVAEAARERLAPDALRLGAGGEVDAFDDGVGLEERLRVGRAELQHGAIVARAGDDKVVGRQQRRQASDEVEFGHTRAERENR